MPPDDQNTTQNPTFEETPSPLSPQDPTEQHPKNTSISEPPEPSQEPQEAQGSDFESKVINEHIPENGQNEPTAEPSPEPENDPEKAPESRTAQTPVIEPFAKKSFARELLIKARNAIQFRKRKKLLTLTQHLNTFYPCFISLLCVKEFSDKQ